MVNRPGAPGLNVIARKWANLQRLNRFSRLWFVPVWLLLGISRGLVLGLSFKRLVSRLGVHSGVSPWVPLLSDDQQARALEIGRLVRLVARYTPWNSNCFAQAVTARILLGFYDVPYALFFGLTRDAATAQMQAHAWVAAGRVRVTGGAGFRQFTVVGCFVAASLAG